MAITTKDADLVSFGQNFSARITASPATFNLTAAEATQYSTLLAGFVSAYQANKNAFDSGTRSKSLAAAKDTAKANFLTFARDLYGTVQSDSTVSDANKALLGIVNRAAPSPRPAPADSPKLTILSVTGSVVKCQVADRAFPDTKRKPATADGVTILSFAGTTPPPAGDPMWKLEGQTGKNIFSVQFTSSVEAGTPCWITCMWYSKRGDYSPACDPVQAYLAIGATEEEAQPMLKAA
ncbi:MAG TPA: hypothetical protein VHS31_16115 [Tepidisphaeraceae bacterium]|jgi:hypothetical protein|nr:hypothetical protein [Tepidisphaeraceae bacterium]